MVWIHLATVKMKFMKAMLSHGAAVGPHVNGQQAVDSAVNQMPPTYTDAQVRIQILDHQQQPKPAVIKPHHWLLGNILVRLVLY